MRIAATGLVLVLMSGLPSPARAAVWEDVIGPGSFGGHGALESEWNYRYP
ncbi:hypothetical protein GCM10011609_25210 [Lentzea pudingi]|uniref:Uncharacterized protein n=1 Tax=Lentzea pudingi TaxID=1789439 RepID=A0ABQ2HR67_9PSEU|nr:hypothetical protein [Lentzea pudingi]GGM87537.1 hypothetical protein GCM10011609_25210 [Lentzea pudingi]